MKEAIKKIIDKSLAEAKQGRKEIEIVNRFYISLFKRLIVENLEYNTEIMENIETTKDILKDTDNIKELSKGYTSFETSAINEALSIFLLNNSRDKNYIYNTYKILCM